MNDKNILPHRYTKGASKARENGRKGGLGRQKQVRERKTIREALKLLVGLPCQHDKLRAAIQAEGIDDEDITNGLAIAYTTMKNAHKRADFARVLFEMLGENDVQGVSKIPGALQVNFSDKPEDFK